MAEDQDAVLEAAKGLPFAERATHKSWFVRAAAHDDIAARCRKALDTFDPLFAEVGEVSESSDKQNIRQQVIDFHGGCLIGVRSVHSGF